MAKNTQLTNAVVNAQADAQATLADHGWIDVLDGTQAATGDTAIGSQVLLVSLRLPTPAFGAASAGVITAGTIAGGTAGASGTATWFRVYKTDHTTALWDGNCGTTGGGFNLEMPTVTITAGASVTASVFTHTVAKATTGF